MSARIRLGTLLACAAVAIGPASACAATDVASARFAGVSVSAVFLQVDGCATRWAGLTAWDGRWTREREGTSELGMLFVNFQTDDPCGIGWQQHFAIVPLAPGALSVRGDLGAATLRGTFPFSDRYEGPPTGSLDVDLAWRAVGPLVRERLRSHTWSRLFGAFRLSATTYGFRPANVSGRLFDGAEEWAGDALVIGTPDILSTRLGTVTIDR